MDKCENSNTTISYLLYHIISIYVLVTNQQSTHRHTQSEKKANRKSLVDSCHRGVADLGRSIVIEWMLVSMLDSFDSFQRC